MITIKAKIKLLKGEGKRETPFVSGYRPLFELIKSTKTSGRIRLIGQENFKPGEEGIVEIDFLNKDLIGNDFRVGKKFAFFESNEELGIGEILKIISL